METLKNRTHAAVVLGGVNMDICGKPYKRTVSRDSNPGLISTCPGGVGRNIAHDLRLLGVKVSLISAFGADGYGRQLLESCGELGIDTQMSALCPGQRSSSYMYITDENGDMQLAVADMDITKNISPLLVEKHLSQIDSFEAVVLDANLEAETLEYAAEHIKAPLYADPVSTAKASRLLNVLPYLTAIKPNLMEAQTLTGKIQPEDCAQALLKMGVQRVYLSLGDKGMIAASGNELKKLPCLPGKVINTTGAGDAAMAALVWAEMEGLGLEETAMTALRAGALTCACEGSNCPELSVITKR